MPSFSEGAFGISWSVNFNQPSRALGRCLFGLKTKNATFGAKTRCILLADQNLDQQYSYLADYFGCLLLLVAELHRCAVTSGERKAQED